MIDIKGLLPIPHGRLTCTLQPWCDKTWKPGDAELGE